MALGTPNPSSALFPPVFLHSCEQEQEDRAVLHRDNGAPGARCQPRTSTPGLFTMGARKPEGSCEGWGLGILWEHLSDGLYFLGGEGGSFLPIKFLHSYEQVPEGCRDPAPGNMPIRLVLQKQRQHHPPAARK